MYTAPLSDVIESYNINYHHDLYADESNLYVALKQMIHPRSKTGLKAVSVIFVVG